MDKTATLSRNHRHRKPRLVYGLLCGVLFMLMLLSLLWGRYPITMSSFMLWVQSLLVPSTATTVSHVLTTIRLPRILAAVIVGVSLSVAGSSYQGVFRNPMVSPDILGASAGAGFGASLAIVWGFPSFWVQQLSFAFGMVAVLVATLLSRMASARGSKTLVLILAGMVVAALFNAMISLIKYTADPYSQLPEITFWLMGGLAGVTFERLLPTLLPFAISLLCLLCIRWRINVLSLGEEEALSLGVNVPLLRGLVIVCSTMLTSLAISLCGQVGWIGLVVPHIARMLVGANYKRLLPVTALLGGIFLLIVDNISRNLMVMEIPLGILTALIGAPLFVFLLLRGKKGWL